MGISFKGGLMKLSYNISMMNVGVVFVVVYEWNVEDKLGFLILGIELDFQIGLDWFFCDVDEK